jgi:hypothetical protein
MVKKSEDSRSLGSSTHLHLLSAPSHTRQAFGTVYNVLLNSHLFLQYPSQRLPSYELHEPSR